MHNDTRSSSSDLPADVLSDRCPSRGTLIHVTSRWAVLVFVVLSKGEHRFGEIRRLIGGISEKMLAQTLQTLAEDGFVQREALPVIPPHVVYRLTEGGQGMARHILGLVRYIETHENTHQPYPNTP